MDHSGNEGTRLNQLLPETQPWDVAPWEGEIKVTAQFESFSKRLAGMILAAGAVMLLAPLAARAQNITIAPVITTVAGNGTSGYSGDGGPATSAQLTFPATVAVDSAGNLYIADYWNFRIRKVDASGTITTVAGNGKGGYSGDGGPATSAELNYPNGVAVDSAGNLYIADEFNQRIRKVSGGIITTVAGNGSWGYSGDGGPATSAQLHGPTDVAVDSAGNLYIADSTNEVIREVSGGIITTVAGDGTGGYNGDDIPPTSAELLNPWGVAVDSAGNLYIADENNQRVRKVTTGTAPINFGQVNVGSNAAQVVILSINTALTLSSVQSSGDYSVTSDSCAPLPAALSANAFCTLQVQFAPTEPGQRWSPLVASDSNSNNYSFGLEGTGVGSALAFTPGIISTVAGTPGASGYSGDGGPATSAELQHAWGVAVDSAGNLYIADTFNQIIRKVNAASGTITTVAGTPGTSGYSGDGGPATSAELSLPYGVAVDSSGNLYIADLGNSLVRKVNASGTITTVAGTPGTIGYSGDGGPATSAELQYAWGVAVDSAGNLYIADTQNCRIRKVNASGTITTVAGNGTSGYSGDGGPATSAELSYPYGVAVDSAGNLYIADTQNYRIRKVNASGTITTVAGNGT